MKFNNSANKQSPFLKSCAEILEKSQLVINEEESTMQSPRSLLSMSSNQLFSAEIQKKSFNSTKKTKKLLEEPSKCFFSFNSADSEVNCLSPINKLNSSYFSEIEACKEEIRNLKLKILKLQKNSAKNLKKDNFPSVSFQEINSKLVKQRESLEKQFKISLRHHKQRIFEDFQQEFEKLHVKLINKLKKQQNRVIQDKKKELEEFFSTELVIIEAEFDEKLKRKQKELDSKQEIIKMLQEENNYLKDLSKNFQDSTEDLKKKLEMLKNSEKFEENSEKIKDFQVLTEKCEKLEQEVRILKTCQDARLCEKCKAFTLSDEKLSKQLSRLKDYLGFSD